MTVRLALLRGNYQGVRWFPVGHHISLGISAHIQGRYSHLSIHLPFGVLVIGCIGVTEESA